MVIRQPAAYVAAVLWAGTAAASVNIDAVAAGDMSDTDVILWTRATDDGGPATIAAQVATDPAFRRIVWSGGGVTVPDNDFTLKLNPKGLASGTRYYYRFAAGTKTQIGQFRTAPAPQQAVPVTFAFSGDADGRFRPYPSIANISRHNLDFFIFLGDVIYETASGRPPTVSPAVPKLTPASTAAEAQLALGAYDRKYLENISGVTETGGLSTFGQHGLAPLFAATGHYTVLDNHELGNASLQSGGAPAAVAAARNPATSAALDANTTGTFVNRSLAFRTVEKPFFNYHPTRIDIAGKPLTELTITGPQVSAPDDPRLDGTARHYFAQSWGRHALYIQTDDRSYRDVRLGDATGAELPVTDPRGDNPNRTMLGATQFAWLKQILLEAKATWKFVIISTPIDMTGEEQDQKSWYGGYRAERDGLLRFIADHAIDHVVFLTTDDHMTRMTRLRYDPGHKLVPGAFQIVTGPIGAGGPDAITRHDFPAILEAVAPRLKSQAALGQPIDGLAGLPGLFAVRREFHPDADRLRQPVDFLSPDTFSYAILAIDPAGVLSVSVVGIPSYPPNQNFRKRPEAEHRIVSFRVRAGAKEAR